MPDITMCWGDNCPIKETCYRYTATPSKWRQSYFAETPIKEDNTCDHFMEIWDKSKERMRISGSNVYIDGELVPEDMIAIIFNQLKDMKDGK